MPELVGREAKRISRRRNLEQKEKEKKRMRKRGTYPGPEAR